MSNRQFDTRTETKSSLSRQPVRRREQGHVAKTSIFPKRGPLPRAISSAGNLLSASTHAAMLKCATAGRPSRAGQSLLQLQRQYGNRYVQRVLALARKGTGEAEAAPELEQSIQQARGGGQAIDKDVQGQMESAFGVDFSGVRVHTDTQADTLNRELNARAFTTGQDIFFRQGAYNPGSSNGQELLAHELTHVVQQNGDKVQRKLTVGQPGDKYEQEADQVARAVMQQEQQPVQGESDEGLVRRQIEEEEEEEVQMKSEYSQVQRQVEEEEEEPVQTKVESAWIQRQIGEEGEEEEVIQPKVEDFLVQRQVEEEEEEIQAKLEDKGVQRQAKEEEALQAKVEHVLMQRQMEKEEEQELVQTKAWAARVRREAEEGRQKEESVKTRTESDRVQWQVEAEEEKKETLMAKAILGWTPELNPKTGINTRVFVDYNVLFGTGQLAPETTLSRRSSARRIAASPKLHKLQLAPPEVTKTEEKRKRKKETEETIWKDIKEKAENRYKNVLKYNMEFMHWTYSNMIKDCFREISKSQKFVLKGVKKYLGPVTIIPIVGSWLAGYLEVVIDDFNERSWNTVEDFCGEFQDAALKQYAREKFRLDQKEQFHEVKKEFLDIFNKSYAPSKDREELKEEISRKIKSLYADYYMPIEYWKDKFNETVGAQIRIFINMQLYAAESPGMITEFLVKKLAAELRTSKKSSPEIIEEFGVSKELREKMFKIVYYHLLQEAAPLIHSNPFAAPAKWHDFLKYCKEEGLHRGTYPEIQEIYESANAYHAMAVKAYLEAVWQRAVENETRVRELFSTRDLLRMWVRQSKELTDFLKKEQKFNKFDISVIATGVATKIIEKRKEYQAILYQREPVFPPIEAPKSGLREEKVQREPNLPIDVVGFSSRS